MAHADSVLENFGQSLASRGGISIKFNNKIDEKPPPDELPMVPKEEMIRESFTIIDP
jgi:hypothetical protein